jgi:hypothetical protein
MLHVNEFWQSVGFRQGISFKIGFDGSLEDGDRF